MVKWMHSQKLRGIRFTTKGNSAPIVLSDASNKPDLNDGLCQYGYVAMFKGGPIGSLSKKLPHIGLSAFMNEYMALRFAASLTMWCRNVLNDIGCTNYVRNPTKLYGDNTAANTLTKKDFVSTGNQHLVLPYHWIKELVKDKYISVHYVPTKMNLADLFTKPVTRQVIETLLSQLTGHDTSWETNVKIASDAHDLERGALKSSITDY
jgi:hypothetical protein